MDSSLFSSWKNNNIIFVSEQNPENLISQLDLFGEAQRMKGFIIFSNDPINLNIYTNKFNFTFHVEPMKQLIVLPGLGMTTKMTGKIVSKDKYSIIEATIKVHLIFKFFLLISLLLEIGILTMNLKLDNMSVKDSLIDFTALIVFQLLILSYLHLNKRKLIQDFSKSFNLNLIKNK